MSPRDPSTTGWPVLTPSAFIAEYLGFDLRQELTPADWLTFSEQRLRTLAVGGVWHDAIGLAEIRSRFACYPHDVWLYLLAAGWARIGQEEHLMGRAGLVGDEVGSALIGARLVRDLMRLCFLMERTYAPYPKWFGTAFRQLRCADALWPFLLAALHAQSWQAREEALAAAYAQVAALHNALHLTDPLPEQPVSFFGRPFRVIAVHGFADALLGQITDPVVKQLAQRPPIGGIDQFSDSTDLLSNPSWRPALRKLYEPVVFLAFLCVCTRLCGGFFQNFLRPPHQRRPLFGPEGDIGCVVDRDSVPVEATREGGAERCACVTKLHRVRIVRRPCAGGGHGRGFARFEGGRTVAPGAGAADKLTPGAPNVHGDGAAFAVEVEGDGLGLLSIWVQAIDPARHPSLRR